MVAFNQGKYPLPREHCTKDNIVSTAQWFIKSFNDSFIANYSSAITAAPTHMIIRHENKAGEIPEVWQSMCASFIQGET